MPQTMTSAGSSPMSARISSSLMSCVSDSDGSAGRTVDEEELASVLEWDSHVGRRSTKATEDELTELRLDFAHAGETRAFMIRLRKEIIGVEGRERAIRDALHHHCSARPRGAATFRAALDPGNTMSPATSSFWKLRFSAVARTARNASSSP